MTINQFTPTLAYGDSVSNALLFMQRLLIGFGFESKIYICDNKTDMKFKNEHFHINEYLESEDNILFYHHSIGHSFHNKIMNFVDKKVMVYHNITPIHFFKTNEHIQALCTLGREQLKNSAKYFIGSFGDSKYNCKELKVHNYLNPVALTVLMDFDKQINYQVNEKLFLKYSYFYNIIYIGRVVSNKCQHQLIDIAFWLRQKGFENFRIHIIGGASEPEYLDFIKDKAKALDLQSHVKITGKVSNEDIMAYYKMADLYLSLSEHEGFGMPLVEAMNYDIPILCYDTCAMSDIIPSKGLLQKKSPSYVAERIMDLKNSPYDRMNLVKEQKSFLRRFHVKQIKNNLIDYLDSLNIIDSLVNKKEKIDINNKISYQIEGPFDSSYSLAIVNKDIAKSLDIDENIVKLYSTEGGGDFEPRFDSLDNQALKMVKLDIDNIDISIRNLYPPRADGLKGYHKIIGPYGWEESKFPQKYIESFNNKLTMVFTMSEYVKKVLKNSGLKIPVITTGLVVDSILNIKSKSFDFDLLDGFKLLHISSGFHRKGLDILLDSFMKLSIDVSLVIKTFPNIHNSILEHLDNRGFNNIKNIEDGVDIYKFKNKKILLINKDIEESQIKFLYENCDIFISPTFGEGFGLPMAEAMLFDMPVITTAYGGQSDFCTDETSWLIDFNFDFAKTHLSIENSLWQVPIVDSLVNKIEEVYNLSDIKRKEKTVKAKDFILKNYSSKQILSNIENAIKNFKDYKDIYNIGLFSTFNTKCGIATYSKYLISSFKDDVIVFANRTDDTLINKDNSKVIRCWDDGRDTKDIVDLKNQLLKNKINKFIIQYNFSFISLKFLGELLNFCKENSIKVYLFLHSTKDVVTANYTDSFSQIINQMLTVENIYIHTLEDMNYLKNFGIYKNTQLFKHGINYQKEVVLDRIENKVPVLASFGFLLPNKGIFEAVDIVEQLNEQGFKVKLLLLTSIHPAPVSVQLKQQLEDRISNSKYKDYITLNTDYLEEDVIISKLSKCDKIIFLYQNTQESSSAAVRMGLLSQREVIVTPLKIFDDVSSVVTYTNSTNNKDIINTIKTSLKTQFCNKKLKSFLSQNSWNLISKNFYNTM
jgi:glycosyltransferase involved in cell wall biosynthesis